MERAGSINPFAHLDAVGQAELVRSGSVTPRELVGAAIDAVAALNGTVNAVIHERFDRALAEADGVDTDAPLAGVPIVVKDLDGTLAGEPCYMGTRHLKDHDYRPDVTSTLIDRLIGAGCVVIGKTNTPELGLLPTTEPATYGPSRNPWNVERSTGGSSGGSAAAVAAGMVPIGHAGDGGGSIRIPASECGLVGLKPTRGLVPIGPVETEPWGGLVARLAVTRTVRDTAAVLDAVAGPAPGDHYRCASPERPFGSLLDAPPERLTIGVMTEAPDGTPVDAEVVAAVEGVADLAARLGHRVVAARPPQFEQASFSDAFIGAFLVAYSVWVAQALDEMGVLSGVPVSPDTVESGTWGLAEMGRGTSAVDYVAATEKLRRLAHDVEVWFEESCDVLLTPTLAELPPGLGEFAPDPANPLAGVIRSTPLVTFTAPFNVTGQPAVSLPLAWSGDGLPIGAHFVGRSGRDDALVALAAEMERERPWSDRRPGVWAG